MEKYSLNKYLGLITQGELRSAVDYLRQFPNKKRLVRKYVQIFDENENKPVSKNKKVQLICSIFQEYYKLIFWQETDKNEALIWLCNKFGTLFEIEFKSDIKNDLEESWEKIENRLAEIVTLEGFQYLGGDTSGFKGPYIWKKTKKKNYNIRLPEGTEKYSVYWMYGFISRSWMAYISLNRLGTGGWADENNELYCVAKTNRKRMLSSSFWMNFLKHEAQHSWDLNHIKGITGGQLEYRAKLVELIYSKKTLKTFYKFLLEANKSDTENTHCIASFRLIQDLSKKIFDREYEDDINIWKKHKKEIRLASSTLLNQDTSILI